MMNPKQKENLLDAMEKNHSKTFKLHTHTHTGINHHRARKIYTENRKKNLDDLRIPKHTKVMTRMTKKWLV